jgi:hypothetical protein
MAEYLMIFRGGDHNLNDAPEEMQARTQRWYTWMQGLSQKGIMLGAQPLQNSGKVVKGRQKVVTDGPFMEGKEMVGGYLVCKADTYEEAVAISKDCPILEIDNGTVEVREISSMQM